MHWAKIPQLTERPTGLSQGLPVGRKVCQTYNWQSCVGFRAFGGGGVTREAEIRCHLPSLSTIHVKEGSSRAGPSLMQGRDLALGCMDLLRIESLHNLGSATSQSACLCLGAPLYTHALQRSRLKATEASWVETVLCSLVIRFHNTGRCR